MPSTENSCNRRSPIYLETKSVFGVFDALHIYVILNSLLYSAGRSVFPEDGSAYSPYHTPYGVPGHLWYWMEFPPPQKNFPRPTSLLPHGLEPLWGETLYSLQTCTSAGRSLTSTCVNLLINLNFVFINYLIFFSRIEYSVSVIKFNYTC